MRKRAPAQTFPPGEYLRDDLEARGRTPAEFAKTAGLPEGLVGEILAGTARIAPETARALGASLGTSAELWLNLEAAHRTSKASPAADPIAGDVPADGNRRGRYRSA